MNQNKTFEEVLLKDCPAVIGTLCSVINTLMKQVENEQKPSKESISHLKHLLSSLKQDYPFLLPTSDIFNNH